MKLSDEMLFYKKEIREDCDIIYFDKDEFYKIVNKVKTQEALIKKMVESLEDYFNKYCNNICVLVDICKNCDKKKFIQQTKEIE